MTAISFKFFKVGINEYKACSQAPGISAYQVTFNLAIKMQRGAPGCSHMKSTLEAISQLAALAEQEGPFMQGCGRPGSSARLGRLSVPKWDFISQPLRWKGGSWPVPPPLPPKVTDE